LNATHGATALLRLDVVHNETLDVNATFISMRKYD
jgi:hypothetical protein